MKWWEVILRLESEFFDSKDVSNHTRFAHSLHTEENEVWGE